MDIMFDDYHDCKECTTLKSQNKELRFRVLELESNLRNAVMMLESINDKPVAVFDVSMMRQALAKQIEKGE